MNLAAKKDILAGHRAPQRVRRSTTLLAIFGAPAAWVIQMSLSEPIAAYACYPHQVPLSAPLWANLEVILAVISLICLTGGVLSGYMAWNAWRRSKSGLVEGGNEEQIIKADKGQARFLALLGMMSSFVFIVAILFTGCAVLLVSPCSAWH